MASVTPRLSKLPLEDTPAVREQQTMSSLEAKVESVIGIGSLNVASLQQGISNDSLEEEHVSVDKQVHNQTNLGVGDRSNMVSLSLQNSSGSAVVPHKMGSSFQGQHFEPMDKSVSQTVKLNPKMELSKPDLLKLLSFMEAELQARDVVIATLKTERIKNLLHYGRVGLNDPFLALQRDSIGGQTFGNVSESELRTIEETQLQQLENLITQQRKAHQRMRQVLREAEKRHAWTVEELEKERRKQESDNLQDDTDYADNDKSKSKQSQELDYERAGKKKIEKELKKLQETLEEERGKQKQIILMLVEERKRLALQYVEERKRSEDLAQILSEEKGRIDSMAEGLEEESKKSLQMEAELEKQLAEFDTEKQQMAAQLSRKEERISELETLCEKLQREVEHYKKQLQEAHNVAMFQQTLSVSPPRIGIGTSPQRPQPPQLPVKPPSLAQGPSRLQAAPAHSNVTKAVQLTATVNSVPVAGPTTGIARGVQPGVGVRSTMYSASSGEINRPITSTAKTYSESENPWVGGTVIDCDTSSTGSTPSSTTPQGGERSLTRVTGGSQAPQVVQVSPRVNVSASSSNKVITTSSHGGKVTFHVTTNTPGAATPSAGIGSSGDQTILKKPTPPTRTSQSVPPPPVPINKPLGAPPVPPNKPMIPPKKVVESPPISVEVKPQKVGPQTVKFGITISKTSGSGSSSVVSSGESSPSSVALTSATGSVSPVSAVAAGIENVISSRRENSQVEEEAVCEMHECEDSLCHELENFHQLFSSMADQSDLVGNSTPVSHHCPSGPALYSSCDFSPPNPPPPPPPTSVGFNDQISKKDSDLAKEMCNYVPKSPNFLSSSSMIDFTCKVLQHHRNNIDSSLSPPSHSPPPPPLPSSSPPLTFESSLSSSSPPSSSIYDTSYLQSHLPVTSFPLVSECEESSASTQTCKGPSMSIPQYMASIPQSPAPLSPTFSPTSNLPRLKFLPVDSTLESNLDDCAPPPHSPIDVATPLTADGMTALHLAAQGNNWQSVAVLIRCGSSINAEDDEGRTPLYLALLYGCVSAAKALLAFPQNIEHSTKAGCNFLHAATKSGEVECVSVISHYIINSVAGGGLPLLYLLATSPDHHGHTPVALALAATSPSMVQVFGQCGIDLKALIAHNPQLLHAASSTSQVELLSVKENESYYCPVLIKSFTMEGNRDENSKWFIGTITVSVTMHWNELEKEILKFVTSHWEELDKLCDKGTDEVDLNDNSEMDVCKSEETLGLSETSVDYYCIFGHYFKKGSSENSLLPYELLKAKNTENPFSKDNQIIVHLNPLHAAAYTTLIPVVLLQNYLKLLDQTKCLVVYGAEYSGKKLLVSMLASLWSGSSNTVQIINMCESSSHSKFIPSAKDALTNGENLVLHSLPKELCHLLSGIIKKGNCEKRGRVLATVDSWRRPCSQLENDIIWIQLRFDRPPLCHFLLQFMNRQIASLCAGGIPPTHSFCSQIIRWVSQSQARLCDTLMSLGFSKALKGPGLFASALSRAFNPTDIIRETEQIWNTKIVPLIIEEVKSVLKISPSCGEEQDPNESRISSMALHVIFRSSFLTGRPQPPKDLLSGFQSRVLQHPKDFASQKTLALSSSPDWNEDSLAKILGLSPVGYAS